MYDYENYRERLRAWYGLDEHDYPWDASQLYYSRGIDYPWRLNEVEKFLYPTWQE